MIAVKEQESQGGYFSAFSEVERRFPGPAWLQEIRQAAIHRFAELGFPTTKNEEWKYTNVAPLARTHFRPALAGGKPGDLALRGIEASPFVTIEATKLVFVDGHFSPQLSTISALPEKVKAGSLAAALKVGSASALLEAHLARHAKYDEHAFAALNTAFIQDGAFIEIPKGLVVEKPICLVYVSTAQTQDGGQPTVTYPRNLIVLGSNAQVALVEVYLGLGASAYLTNAVTEVVVGEGAVVEYTKLQQEREAAFHVASVQFHQARSSTVHSTIVALGGALVREDTGTVLDGEGSECTLNGLYVTLGRQHVDNHTIIDHAKPHCGSRELYKGVLEGSSEGVFDGKIIVRKDAQKTDSKQSNKNLLLSEAAVINTKPQLEIYADDVKCTHGATIGQIDQDALFYLRSRGIGAEDARALLTQAFANEVLDKIKSKPLRTALKDGVLARLARSAQLQSGGAHEGVLKGRISTLEEA